MMKRALLLVGILGLTGARADEVILASESYYLSKSEVAASSAAALAGSSDAAVKLMNFYWMSGKKDIPRAKYWAVIGAENGSIEAQFRAWQTLSISRNPDEQRRAIFWLKKAADENYLGSKETLARCGSWPDPPQRKKAAACFGPAAGPRQ